MTNPAADAAAAPPILWSGYLFEQTGFAQEGRNLVLGLDRAGVDIYANPVRWDTWLARPASPATQRLHELSLRRRPEQFVHLLHMQPPYFYQHPDASRQIGRCMYETDRIPADWVAACAALDEIWVPSEFNLETFAQSGVPREKLFKIPESIQIEYFDPSLPPLDFEGIEGFTFLSVFGWSRRKGWDLLVRAYVEEFARGEPVALVLKTSVAHVREPALQLAALEAYLRDGLGRDPGTIPPIRLLGFNLMPEDMGRLYHAADAFVLPSHGEGWGRPYMEAMAAGLPAIGTRWSGNLDFMTDDNSYLIDCELVDVPEEAWREVPGFRGHRWAEPSVEHLRRLMRRVFEQREEATEKGARARAEVLDRCSWPRVSEQIVERLGPARSASPAIRSREPIRVAWDGPQFAHYSMAHVNRELCRELLKTERVDLTLIAPPGGDPSLRAGSRFAQLAAREAAPAPASVEVHVAHKWPPGLEPPAEGRWVIYQPWEFGSLPREWIGPLNTLVDEIWVPTTYVRDCFLKSGVEPSRVFVVPNGVDPERFRPPAPPLARDTRKRFKFLFVGGTIHRKGIDILLRTYCETFRRGDDVCLVIKDFGADSFYRGQTARERIQALAADPLNPEILYLDGELPDEAMPGLYTACDALVHPYLGEGFGLPIAEAMACGLPVIVPGAGACLDFCDPSSAYLVRAAEVLGTAPNIGGIPTVDLPRFAQVDPDALAQAMRGVVEHPDEARLVGLRASARIRRDFTWKRAAEIALRRLEDLAAAPARRLATPVLAPQRKQLSVCLMTKNEEAFLPACLESVRGLADEIIVVDTGSSDRTVEIARQFGAKIHAYRWNDDFAEARNESLRHATKDWLLVLDADHTVDPSGHDEIRRIVQRDEFAGYMLRQFNYTDEHGTESVLEHLNLRLFPNHPAVGYAGRIHEQVICRNADLSFKVHACGAILHHHGLRPQVFKQRGKAERDRRVLLEMAREDPENAFHAHNLGMTHAALGEYAEAERALRRAIELSMPQLQGGPYPLYLVSTHLILARALLAQGRNAEAVQCCAAAVRLAPNFADAQLLLGTAELRLGHLDEALRSYERARRCSDGWRFGPSDHSASGWRALLGMGEVYLVQRQWRQAAAHLEQAVARSAKARALFPALARVCVEIVGAAEAEQGLGELLDATGAAAARLLLAEVFLADGAAEQALEQLTEALRDDEQNPEILSRMAEAFQRLGCAGEAEAARQASQLPRMDRATPGPAQPTGRATPAR